MGDDVLADKVKQLAENRMARHEYFIEERFEAGIALSGTEVKSIRQGALNLKEAYCLVQNGELFVRKMHVSPYEQGGPFNTDPLRPRRLLMHKREIFRLGARVAQEGFALIPLRIYLKAARVKMEIALCKGKKMHDKREDQARRTAVREMEQRLKENRR